MMRSYSSTVIATSSACAAGAVSYFTNQSPFPALFTFLNGRMVTEACILARYHLPPEHHEVIIPEGGTAMCVVLSILSDSFLIDPSREPFQTICASLVGMTVNYMITMLFLDIFNPQELGEE